MKMLLRHSSKPWLFGPLLIGFLASVVLAQQVPPRTFAGQTLEVPEALLDEGMVYHLQPAVDTQIAITSDALLQRLVVTADRAIGYVVAPFDLEAEATPLIAAAVRIPVVGLTTGLAQIDPMLHGPQILKAGEHPEITLLLKKLNSFKSTRFDADEMSFDLKLTAVLSLLGGSRDLELDARLSFLPSSGTTMARNVGDMAAFRTSLEVKAADLGLEIPPRLRTRLSEDLRIDVFLMFNTISPDRSGDPRDEPAIYEKQLHFTTLLEDLQQVDDAYRYALELSREIWDNPKELNRLARAMSTTREADARDLAFARRLAARAIEASSQPDPQILSGMARIEEALGNLEEAVGWLEKAVQAAPEGRPRQGLTRQLESLRKKAGSRSG